MAKHKENMIPHQRRVEILRILGIEGSAKVSYLSDLLKVTEVTIRRDLDVLSKEGKIYKKHGGAFLKLNPENMETLSPQKIENLDNKALIGKKAATFIYSGDTVIIDAGSTTDELAKAISDSTQLIVITNSLPVAIHLGAKRSIEILLAGGEFSALRLSVIGSKAAEFFEDMHVDKLFLSAFGVSIKKGMIYAGVGHIPVKKAMIEAAEKVFLLADSTKFDKMSFASFASLECIDVLITDASITKEHQDRLAQFSIEVVIA